MISATTTSLTFSFTAPTTGSTPTGYTPYINGSAGTGTGTPSSYTISGLTGSTSYSVAMEAAIASSLPFDPKSITGCCTWMDASDSTVITQSAGKVSAWTDKSTNGFQFTQSTSVSQPSYVTNSLNGRPTLSFTSDQSTYGNYLAGPTNFAVGTNSYALFAVFKFNDATSGGAIFNKSLYGDQNGRIILLREGANLVVRITDATQGGSSFAETYAGNTYRVLCMIYNRTAANCSVYNNGTLVDSIGASTSSVNLTNTDTFVIGGYNDGGGTLNPPYAPLYLKGNIAEILSYSNNYDMTSSTRQQIEGYLAWKWGLQTSLPGAHPYYSAAPTGGTTTTYQKSTSVSLRTA